MSDSGWLFIVLGFFGALLTSTSWLPQIAKGWRSRRLDDLSWGTLTIFGLGTLCWLAYGIFRVDWLIIGANSFITICIGMLLSMKVIFSRENG